MHEKSKERRNLKSLINITKKKNRSQDNVFKALQLKIPAFRIMNHFILSVRVEYP